MSESQISSFILRFIQESDTNTAPAAHPWRAMIRHVQSDEQLHFTRVDEALAFIGRYVNFETHEDTGA